jgi:hypothetical protein
MFFRITRFKDSDQSIIQISIIVSWAAWVCGFENVIPLSAPKIFLFSLPRHDDFYTQKTPLNITPHYYKYNSHTEAIMPHCLYFSNFAFIVPYCHTSHVIFIVPPSLLCFYISPFFFYIFIFVP